MRWSPLGRFDFFGGFGARGTRSALRAATVRRKRKRGFLRRFRMGKLLTRVAHFTASLTPPGRLISSARRVFSVASKL